MSITSTLSTSTGTGTSIRRRLAGLAVGLTVGTVGFGSTGVSADSSDFNVWRSNFGTSTAATGDFDADGDVDGRDFLVWQRHTG